MKVLYSGAYYDDGHPFNKLCDNVDVAREPDDLKESDAGLIIWGGADIHPNYYNRPMHSTTFPGGARDRVEWSLIQRAIEMGITILGVCRGAQMGCAAAGGWLIQDVAGHIGGHDVTTFDGKSFRVNSIHHQMMVPNDVPHELVAWSSTNRSASSRSGFTPAYGIDDNKWWDAPEGWKEPEYVYFPKIHCHAIQWHPEGMATDSPATKYILDFISRKEEERAQRGKITV